MASGEKIITRLSDWRRALNEQNIKITMTVQTLSRIGQSLCTGEDDKVSEFVNDVWGLLSSAEPILGKVIISICIY